jgi:tetratricopeptide (TPR) repeat protein
MVDEVSPSKSETLTWSDVAGLAEETFAEFRQPGLEIGASDWAYQAWDTLIQAGLARYSTETEHCQVIIRFFALAGFYLEFCSIAWKENVKANYYFWAEALGFIHYYAIHHYAEELVSSDSDCESFEDDDYELDDSALQKLADSVRQEVLSALLDGFGNILVLFASLWRSNTPEIGEDDEPEDCYETDDEILNYNLTPQKLTVLSWLNQQCSGKLVIEEVFNDLANAHYKLVNYQTAIQNYNGALDINPSFALAYRNRGSAYLQLGDKQKAIEDLCRAAELFDQQGNIDNYEEVQRILKTIQLDYSEPSFTEICTNVLSQGLRIAERTLRRYHLALKSRKFVILSGITGTGKSWLTKAYAQAVEAEYLLVPVAPNWTTNEDLLGYLSPIDNKYHDTDFSTFLERAEKEYQQAQAAELTPRAYHLVLDEMNLARVEYYFAKFLSAMEVRMREGVAQIQLASEKQVLLPPNLYFIGTVNVDETTHSFADKVYDRAQLIELEAPRQDLYEHLGEVPYREMLMQIWDEVQGVAPFAFRVLDEIKTYVKEAEALGVSWQHALDEQLLQKILPKLKGADDRVGVALKAFVDIVKENDFPLSHKKATKMLETFNQHGFTSYF